jgi:hypothetical protein
VQHLVLLVLSKLLVLVQTDYCKRAQQVESREIGQQLM